MINYNGELVSNEFVLSTQNRGYLYGDALFETLKIQNGKILFWEDHYFRLMASMRILRMEIPMNFTLEYLEQQIFKVLEANGLEHIFARVKFMVFRDSSGLYTPDTNTIGYCISANKLENTTYKLHNLHYEVELFNSFLVAPSLLSTLKTNNKALHVVGSIFAKENNYNNCLILNTNKQVIEALNGNIFMVQANVIKTPPLTDGCLKGIMRKQILQLAKFFPDYSFEETSILPYELQKADELFITNVIQGIVPITKYRKKSYNTNVATMLLEKLNAQIN